MISPRVTITIKEKETGLYFGYPCFNNYTTACLDQPEYVSLTDGAGVAKLLQCAYDNACLINEEKPVLKYSDFYQFVEDKINEDKKHEIEELLNTWAECTTTKKALERLKELTGTDEKKSPMTIAV